PLLRLLVSLFGAMRQIRRDVWAVSRIHWPSDLLNRSGFGFVILPVNPLVWCCHAEITTAAPLAAKKIYEIAIVKQKAFQRTTLLQAGIVFRFSQANSKKIGAFESHRQWF